MTRLTTAINDLIRILLVLADDVAADRAGSSTRLCFTLNLAAAAPLKFLLVEIILERGWAHRRLCDSRADANVQKSRNPRRLTVGHRWHSRTLCWPVCTADRAPISPKRDL